MQFCFRELKKSEVKIAKAIAKSICLKLHITPSNISAFTWVISGFIISEITKIKFKTERRDKCKIRNSPFYERQRIYEYNDEYIRNSGTDGMSELWDCDLEFITLNAICKRMEKQNAKIRSRCTKN